MDEHVGGIEGLERWMIAGNGGYGVSIGTGYTGGKFNSKVWSEVGRKS